jgi:hypothetical protein
MFEKESRVWSKMAVAFIRIPIASNQSAISLVDHDRSHDISYPPLRIDLDDGIDRNNDCIEDGIFDGSTSIELEILF